ncbi:MAG: hypothetical protein NT023_16545 [Armatimonadetes bacterium]|nr:hypothetical protein [Armatimonadota bacterium]
MTVYNPIGPSVSWRRQYRTLRGEYTVPSGFSPYAQVALGYGWNTGYDMQVLFYGNSQISLVNPNGSQYLFVIPKDGAGNPVIPTESAPSVRCDSATPGLPMLCEWRLNDDSTFSVDFTQNDRSHLVFSSATGYALTQITDALGNYITFAYDTMGSGSGYRLGAVLDSNGNPLLTMRYNSQNNLTSVSDRYGRSVYYHVRPVPYNTNEPPFSKYKYQLEQVSVITRTGTASPRVRYSFGYYYHTFHGVLKYPLLNSISVPSPTGQGYSVAKILYSGFYAVALVDANGNRRSYGGVDGTRSYVSVKNAKGVTLNSYVIGYDSKMRIVSKTDGSGQTVVTRYGYSAENAFQPSTITNGNGNTETITYDSFGRQTSRTSARGVQTVWTWDYSQFPMGELVQVQEGGKIPTTFTYFEPSGLLASYSRPAPGSSSATGVKSVTTSFTYDNLGNVLTATAPGNSVSPLVTFTFEYKQDGTYKQSAARRQPIAIADNLGRTTHLRYDKQGNLIAVADALGIRKDFIYNIANQPLRTLAPPVNDVTSRLSATLPSAYKDEGGGVKSGTIVLTHNGATPLTGNLLVAITNLTPGIKLNNATGTFVNSPYILTSAVSLGAGQSVNVPVKFQWTAGNIFYGVQVYLTDAAGNPLGQRVASESAYLYPGGPVIARTTYDETGSSVRQTRILRGKEGEFLGQTGSAEPVALTFDGQYRITSLKDGNGNITQYKYNSAGYLVPLQAIKGWD